MDLGYTGWTGKFSTVSGYRKREMIANALFVAMAILTLLSISGSMIHIFKNLDR
jgi:hypothetical protein